MLHKAKKMNPDAIVIAAGCYVQTDEGKLDKDDAVDLILGNNQKKNIVEVLEEYEQQHTKQKHVIKINQTKEYEDLAIDHTAEHVRAYIKVQDGCNQFCTYCIIPYARGRVRSRKIAHVLEEVRALAEKGYKEVVLTGIHLTSYGVDFPEGEKETLLSLIQGVHEIDGLSGSVWDHWNLELSQRNLRKPSLHFRKCVPISICPFRADVMLRWRG